jgi:hypothetical protein
MIDFLVTTSQFEANSHENLESPMQLMLLVPAGQDQRAQETSYIQIIDI